MFAKGGGEVRDGYHPSDAQLIAGGGHHPQDVDAGEPKHEDVDQGHIPCRFHR